MRYAVSLCHSGHGPGFCFFCAVCRCFFFVLVLSWAAVAVDGLHEKVHQKKPALFVDLCRETIYFLDNTNTPQVLFSPSRSMVTEKRVQQIISTVRTLAHCTLVRVLWY